MTVDLERALHDAAASAPVGDPWDDARLASVRGRIRRRRAARTGAMSVAGVGAAGVLVLGSGQLLQLGGGMSAGDEAADGGGAPAGLGPDAGGETDGLVCGATVVVPDPAQDPGDVALRFTVEEQVDPVPVGDRLELEATVTNQGDEHLTGTTSMGPTVLVARDGVVVAQRDAMPEMAALLDLAPGATADFPGTNALLSCGAAGEVPEGDALPEGTYQFFLEQTFYLADDPAADPTPVTVLDGPWAFEVGDGGPAVPGD